jgi:uncharacterized protein YbaP (TraB family)
MIAAALRDRPARYRPRLALAALAGLLLLVPPATAAGERPFGEGLLWRVERAGQAPSHVYGTMHTADGEVAALPRVVTETLDGSASVVLEIVTTDQVRGELARSMILPNGEDLSAILGPERFERVVRAGARYGLPGAQLRLFKPWALTMVFSLPPSEVLRQAAGGMPLDQVLQERARSRGTPLYGIETLDEQVAVLAEVPEAKQLALLDAAVEANARIESIFESMKHAYLDRDLGALHGLAEDMSEGADAELQRLLLARMIDDRNARMVRRLAPRLAEGKAFVAVGALHLSGARGILKLLEDEGYRISRVY